MARGKIIKFTPKQIKEIEPVYQKLNKSKPGMIIGQIYEDHMDIGYVPYEKAIEIQKIMNPNKVGDYICTAYDKEK